MELTNMKVDPAEREKAHTAVCAEPDRSAYPWGLEVRLDREALDKLALEELPEVGTELQLHAIVSVTAVSSHEDANTKKPHRSVTLQITDLGLAPHVQKPDAATALYKKD